MRPTSGCERIHGFAMAILVAKLSFIILSEAIVSAASSVATAAAVAAVAASRVFSSTPCGHIEGRFS